MVCYLGCVDFFEIVYYVICEDCKCNCLWLKVEFEIIFIIWFVCVWVKELNKLGVFVGVVFFLVEVFEYL